MASFSAVAVIKASVFPNKRNTVFLSFQNTAQNKWLATYEMECLQGNSLQANASTWAQAQIKLTLGSFCKPILQKNGLIKKAAFVQLGFDWGFHCLTKQKKKNSLNTLS